MRRCRAKVHCLYQHVLNDDAPADKTGPDCRNRKAYGLDDGSVVPRLDERDDSPLTARFANGEIVLRPEGTARDEPSVLRPGGTLRK